MCTRFSLCQIFADFEFDVSTPHPNWIRCDGDEVRSRQLRSDTDRAHSPVTVGPPLANFMPDSNRDILMQMGFSYEQAQAALDNTGGDLQEAGMLLAAGLE